MRGLEFCPTCNTGLPDGRVEGPFREGEWPFEFVFRPIVAQLAGYSWAFDALTPAVMWWLMDDEDALEAGPDGYVPGYQVFPKCAGHILNDWCEFFGVITPALPAADFFRRCRDDWNYAREHADIGFYCIDGARWMLFARDEALLTFMLSHHREVLAPRGIQVRPLTSPAIE